MESVIHDYLLWMMAMCVLLTLLIYNSIICIYAKKRSFLYYVIFNILLLIYTGSKGHLYNLPHLNWAIQIAYNLAYLQFFRYFLNIKQEAPRLDNFMHKFVEISIGLSALVYFALWISNLRAYFYEYFLYIFLPAILIVSVYCLYRAFRFGSRLKHYVIFGTIIYIVFALYALYISHYRLPFFGYPSISPFYIGIMLETILFSMGLGHKLKKMMDERVAAKYKFIEQLDENEKLRNEANKALEKELALKTEEITAMLKAKEREKLETLQMEYRRKISELNLISLRNQLNPHFIFNALNAIKSAIILDRKRDATSYLNKFSKLLREILRKPDNGVYTLEQELDTLKLYLNLENIRLEKKVDFQFEIGDGIDLKSYYIPPLLLQPLAENAIWHGLANLADSDKKIRINVFKNKGESHINIHLEDNGIGLKKAGEIRKQKTYKRESLGVKLVKNRLEIFAEQRDSDYVLTYINLADENPDKHGARVEIKLPFSETK